MEVKRAIELLKSRNKFVADINLDAKIAYKMGVEALEKQIPLEVKYDEDGYKSICPSCGVSDIGEDYYCWKCGQKLKWE